MVAQWSSKVTTISLYTTSQIHDLGVKTHGGKVL